MREHGEGAGESCEFSDCNVKSDPEGRREKRERGLVLLSTEGSRRPLEALKVLHHRRWAASPAPVGSVALELVP